jgi:hypothetical protein
VVTGPDIAAGTFVYAAGEPLLAEVELGANPLKIDHVWIDIDAGFRLRLAVNTLSKRNRDAGFEPRVRVGRVRTSGATPPPAGITPHPGLDYAELEREQNVFFETFERREVEDLLLARTREATFIEAWGAFYRSKHAGIHQIHSRRTSCAVAEDLRGHDGALGFYFDGGYLRELLLFKFCGQP